MSGARALTLLCHWGNCKTKEDSIMHRRILPHVKVRLKVLCPQKLRIAAATLIRLGGVRPILCNASGMYRQLEVVLCTVGAVSPRFVCTLHTAYSLLTYALNLQVHGGVDLRLNSKPSSVHRRIPSDEALMRMAAHHRAAVPRMPTVMSPPTSPNPSQDLTSIVSAMHEGTSSVPCMVWFPNDLLLSLSSGASQRQCSCSLLDNL